MYKINHHYHCYLWMLPVPALDQCQADPSDWPSPYAGPARSSHQLAGGGCHPAVTAWHRQLAGVQGWRRHVVEQAAVVALWKRPRLVCIIAVILQTGSSDLWACRSTELILPCQMTAFMSLNSDFELSLKHYFSVKVASVSHIHYFTYFNRRLNRHWASGKWNEQNIRTCFTEGWMIELIKP